MKSHAGLRERFERLSRAMQGARETRGWISLPAVRPRRCKPLTSTHKHSRLGDDFTRVTAHPSEPRATGAMPWWPFRGSLRSSFAVSDPAGSGAGASADAAPADGGDASPEGTEALRRFETITPAGGPDQASAEEQTTAGGRAPQQQRAMCHHLPANFGPASARRRFDSQGREAQGTAG